VVQRGCPFRTIFNCICHSDARSQQILSQQCLHLVAIIVTLSCFREVDVGPHGSGSMVEGLWPWMGVFRFDDCPGVGLCKKHCLADFVQKAGVS
jgi:hypothetical protein